MQNKFQSKYRISSARLQSWDYSLKGAYFITICTQNREHFFGKIENEKMRLSEIGKSTEHFWLEIPNHFPFVELGNFLIMPNHIHGILIINNSTVETRFIASENENFGGICGDKNPMLHENISKIIRWYKGRCSFEFRKIDSNFGWQSRFHDHIIRNSKSFEIIQNYIVENPSKWNSDKFFK